MEKISKYKCIKAIAWMLVYIFSQIYSVNQAQKLSEQNVLKIGPGEIIEWARPEFESSTSTATCLPITPAQWVGDGDKRIPGLCWLAAELQIPLASMYVYMHAHQHTCACSSSSNTNKI